MENTFENLNEFTASTGTQEDFSLNIEGALASQVKDLNAKIVSLESNVEYQREIAVQNRNKLVTFENTLKDILISQVDSGDISIEAAKYISEGMGIEITKTVLVSGTISFSGRVDVSLFDDVDEMSRYNVYANLSVEYDGEDLYDFDCDVEDTEFETSSS
jgi:hypothetical protein